MKLLKLLSSFLLLLVFTVGCATHAKIEVPVTKKISSPQWQHKSFNIDIFYSQPEPGMFSSGEQQQLKPLEEAKLSLGAAQVLINLPQTVMNQLPMNTSYSDSGDADYRLRIDLVAHHKGGPTYADHEFIKSLTKGILTLGVGADEYNIVADFDVTYTLQNKTGQKYTKTFGVSESVDHERGAVEFKNNTFDYASALLKKHIMITSSAFLKEASLKL